MGNGEPGCSDPVRKAMEGTSPGQKQWEWSSLYDQSSKVLDPGLASGFMETTEVFSRGGGLVTAAITKSTNYSNKSTPSSTLTVAKSSLDTFPVPQTLQTNHQEASFHRTAKSSLLSTIPPSSNHSSLLTATHHMESISSSTIMKTTLNILTVNLRTLHKTDATVLSPTWIPELGKSLK